MSLDKLIKECIKDFEIIPNKKKQIKDDMVGLTSKITELKDILNNIESKIYLEEILTDKNLKNEKSRNAMLIVLLLEHKDYKINQKMLREHETSKGYLESDLMKLRAKVTLYGIISKFTEEKKNE